MFCSLAEAIADFRAGEFVVLVDSSERENEGDLITAAQSITPAKINRMLKEARGMFLLATTQERLRAMGIDPIAKRHADHDGPNMCLPFDARYGITTGISVQDRARTVLQAVDEQCGPDDFVVPGHVQPLAAKDGGLRERQGHTEASVELARLAGLFPAAVMSEVLTEEGDMAKGADLKDFAERFGCRIVQVEAIERGARESELAGVEAE